MAEETKPETVEPKTEETQQPSFAKKWMVIIPVILIILGAQTYAAYYTVKTLFFDKVEVEIERLNDSLLVAIDSTALDSLKMAEETAFKSTGLIKEFEDIIVNPAGTEGRRYFVLTLSMEVDKSKCLDELETKTPIVRDALITLLSSKKLDYLSDVANMEDLRKEIIDESNLYLEKGKVIRVYFTGYVLQ